jgi:hypothetical protein
MTDTRDSQNRRQCHQFQPSGLRCGSPALRDDHFCYNHSSARRPVPASTDPDAFILPLVTDRASLQVALAQVIVRIAANTLDPKRAGLLLYALQTASSNLPPTTEPAPTDPVPPTKPGGPCPDSGTWVPTNPAEPSATSLVRHSELRSESP